MALFVLSISQNANKFTRSWDGLNLNYVVLGVKSELRFAGGAAVALWKGPADSTVKPQERQGDFACLIVCQILPKLLFVYLFELLKPLWRQFYGVHGAQ